jgi:alpha-beta hydrolase superfamily lysophospholipase
MATITTKDGTTIFYKDWGSGQPILFSHGWPLSADAWDGQMLFFGQQGYRVIAHDRRSHGRSDQTWDGNNMDQYADDLAELIEKLDLRNIIMIGHSTGGGFSMSGGTAPTPIRKARRSRSSTASARTPPATARSSSRTSPCRSTASTATARRSTKACANPSGFRA